MAEPFPDGTWYETTEDLNYPVFRVGDPWLAGYELNADPTLTTGRDLGFRSRVVSGGGGSVELFGGVRLDAVPGVRTDSVIYLRADIMLREAPGYALLDWFIGPTKEQVMRLLHNRSLSVDSTLGPREIDVGGGSDDRSIAFRVMEAP